MTAHDQHLFSDCQNQWKSDSSPSRTTPDVAHGYRLAHAARGAPDTSHEAARRIEPISGELCRRVLHFIRSCGAHGATDAEVQHSLAMLTQTETARRNALARVGAVVNSGRTRLTPSRRRAIVWVTPENMG